MQTIILFNKDFKNIIFIDMIWIWASEAMQICPEVGSSSSLYDVRRCSYDLTCLFFHKKSFISWNLDGHYASSNIHIDTAVYKRVELQISMIKLTRPLNLKIFEEFEITYSRKLHVCEAAWTSTNNWLMQLMSKYQKIHDFDNRFNLIWIMIKFTNNSQIYQSSFQEN